ncbi:MAG: GNAT family N-acyltransferase [Candidatus Omnitrophota bacterium]
MQNLSNLKIKIRCSPEELSEAQKLRFQVFNLEMNSGLKSSYATGLDQDAFDEDCEHVIIEDTKHHIVIGTYRMLLDQVARKRKGFYSEKEFDLSPLLRLEGGLLEAGRSCIHKDYRRKSILSFLWQGIAQYAIEHHVRYIFGCASIFTVDPRKVNQTFCMLKKKRYFADLDVHPKDKEHGISINEDLPCEHPEEIFNELPPLFKGYLNLGLKVCGTPAIDREFQTTDFFVILDIKHMNPSYKRRLFGNYLEENSASSKAERKLYANP